MKTLVIVRSLLLAAAGAVALGLPACSDDLERNTRAPNEAPRSHLQQQVGDAELKSRVDAALKADGHLQADAITVTVKKGEVTLAGAVPPDQITRADEIARHITGVAVVINALRSAAPAS